VAGMAYAGTDAETLAAISALEKLPNVRMTGYLKRTQVPAFLGDATALLCTSHFEGFSNTFLEAFAAGTPVLTRKGVDPDGIVARHQLGHTAENDAGLIAAIARLSTLPAADYDALANRARAYVKAHHAPRAAMQKVVGKIEEVVARRP
jgi:glycosyltransferase involved in cell wall biosynthesis